MADSEQKKPLTKNQEKNEAKRRAKMEKFLAKQKKQQVILILLLLLLYKIKLIIYDLLLFEIRVDIILVEKMLKFLKYIELKN